MDARSEKRIGTLSIRVSDTTERRVKAYASAHDLSTSEVVNRAVDLFLDHEFALADKLIQAMRDGEELSGRTGADR